MSNGNKIIQRQIDLKINELKKVYQNDEDALEVIDREIETVKNYEKEGKFQQAKSDIVNLEAFLHDWYPV